MFEIGGLELLVIIIVAMVVLGPDKLPHAAVKTARLFNQLRRAWTHFQRQLFIEIALDETRPNSPGGRAAPQTEQDTPPGKSSVRAASAPYPGGSSLKPEFSPQDDKKAGSQ